MFVWYKVPKDIPSSDKGYGSHGTREGQERLSSDEEEEKGTEDQVPDAEPVHDTPDAEPQ